MSVRGAIAGLALGLLLRAGGARAQDVPRVVEPEGGAARALRVGGLLGFEFTNGETGLGLRADGELPLRVLGPRIDLAAVGSLGYTRFSETTTTGIGEYSQATNILKLVPAARFSLPLAPRLGAYGDVGLGLYWARTSFETPFAEGSDSGVGATMRFAAGGGYDLGERLRLGGELSWNPYFGDLSEDTFALLASLVYRP